MENEEQNANDAKADSWCSRESEEANKQPSLKADQEEMPQGQEPDATEVAEDSDDDAQNPQAILPIPSLTGIGRMVKGDDGKLYVIDEANWKPQQQVGPGGFPIMVSTEGGKEVLSLLSPLLLDALKTVMKRTQDPYITQSEDRISFKEPYVPLFFHYDALVKSAIILLEDSPSSFDSRDLSILRFWYEKRVLSFHIGLKETLSNGWVNYEDLWALFQPGDLLYRMNKFRQPRLFVISATQSREGSTDMGDVNIPFSGLMMQKPRFVVEAWFIDWDFSFQVFKRERELIAIRPFSGSRRVTDLDCYPLKFYKDGDQEAIDKLLSQLTQRGHLWKELVSQPPACMYHYGPAVEIKKDALGTVEERDNRSV